MMRHVSIGFIQGFVEIHVRCERCRFKCSEITRRPLTCFFLLYPSEFEKGKWYDKAKRPGKIRRKVVLKLNRLMERR